MARTKAPRLAGALAVLAVVTSACSSTSSRLPLTRAAGVDSSSASQQDIAADAGGPQSALGPLDQRLVPDVLVRMPAPLQSSQTTELESLVPAGRSVLLRTGTVNLSGPSASGDVSVAGVDPAAFRRFTPQNTAEVTGVWDNVAKGYMALSYDAAKRFGVPLGGKVTVAGKPIDVGALADTGLPGIDAVVSNDVASTLGLPAPNGVVLSGGKDDPTPLVIDVRKTVAKDARVDLLRAPSEQMSFFNVGDARRRLGTLTYQVMPDGSVVVDPKWVAANIVTETVPIIGRMTCHKAMFPQLIKALTEIQAAGLADKIHPDQYEGCYYPKLIEDSNDISMHAWGLAFDLNTVTNQRLTHGDMDPGVVVIFKKWGFRWGGDWKDTPDPMHFELASLLNL
ncbi:MAG: M15 family metallopeptidase [Acidimicrobiia bacterium]|nr:M15 family metallopeptidase [Acidimicrobiia bacterium]